MKVLLYVHFLGIKNIAFHYFSTFGLVGNIHNGHSQKHWDSAEHLRYIISELERGFVQVTHLKKSEF